MTGKFDRLPPETRTMLEKAEATIRYMDGKTLTRAQDVSDYFMAQIQLLHYDIACLKAQVDLHEQDIRELRKHPL